jgi:hypothetical protein
MFVQNHSTTDETVQYLLFLCQACTDIEIKIQAVHALTNSYVPGESS